MPESNPSLQTIPEGLDLIPQGDGALIVRKWRSWQVIPLFLFAIFWNAIALTWYFQALSKPHPNGGMVTFPLPHLAIGIGMAYFAFASLFNSTTLKISSWGVQVRIGPMPWPGNKDVSASKITEIVVRERQKQRNHTFSRPGHTYHVMYAGEDLKERRLVSSLPEPEQGEFVARVIRGVLRLKQAPSTPAISSERSYYIP